MRKLKRRGRNLVVPASRGPLLFRCCRPCQVQLLFDSSLRTISTMLGSRVTCLLLAAVLLASTSHGQQLTQYSHSAWRFQEGVFDASPVSIAQTTDGFLWIC